MKPLTLIRGLPGSGKSTLARKLVSENPGTIDWETDLYFINEMGQYVFNGAEIAKAHAWCQDNVLHCLIGGFNVVVSNTFTTFKEMEPYFKMAESLGLSVDVIHVTTQFGSVHDVPEKTLKRMADRWEPYPSETFYPPVNVE